MSAAAGADGALARPVTEVAATDVWDLDSLTAARGALTEGFPTGVPPFLPPVK